MKHYILALSCLLIISSHVAAEEARYVTDSFEITVRTGKGTSHKIIKSIKSGTRVELLEDDPEGYSRVRLDSETEGWVLTRYLINNPIASVQLERANKQIDSLKSELDSIKQELKETSKNATSLSKSSSSLEKDNQRLQKELNHIREISSNQLAINDENKELKEKLLALKREMQTVQQENLSLKDNSGRHWFMIGAGVVILGIILGLVLPNLKFRRRQSWSSL